MSNFINKAKEQYKKLEIQLAESNSRFNEKAITTMAYECAVIVYKYLSALKLEMYSRLNKRQILFHNDEEEIMFFKQIKPLFLSKMIYYTKINEIMIKLPVGSRKAQLEYLDQQLEKIQRYFTNNRELYLYYRKGETQLDHLFFKRNNAESRIAFDYLLIDADENFSTGFDIALSKILADEQLQVFIESQKAQITGIGLTAVHKQEQDAGVKLVWTEPKAALVELLYALHCYGALNNGKASLKEIANCLQKAFGIDLSGYYHTYLRVTERKMGYTKFLDELKMHLQKRIEHSIQNS